MHNTAELQQNEFIAEFWQVASDFYGKRRVRSLLISLQDNYALSINRLLFALWYSQKFKQIIDEAPLATNEQRKKNRDRYAGDALTKAENAVNALRQVRRDFEQSYSKPYLGNINMTRYHLLEAELSLEKEIQTSLVVGFCTKQTIVSQSPPVENSLSDETLEFIISENIVRLCGNHPSAIDSLLQQLAMLWIQR
jgi:uncharacterized protein (TIGR02444 family)